MLLMILSACSAFFNVLAWCSCFLLSTVGTVTGTGTVTLKVGTGTIKNSYGPQYWSCSMCAMTFPRSSNLQIHVEVHTGEKPLECSTCPTLFSVLGNSHTHVRSHSGEKSYSCSLCNKSFARSTHLRRHVRIHTDEKPHSCSQFSISFFEAGDLRIHVKRSHRLETLQLLLLHIVFYSLKYLAGTSKSSHWWETL